jgi:hypothetical protein
VGKMSDRSARKRVDDEARANTAAVARAKGLRPASTAEMLAAVSK